MNLAVRIAPSDRIFEIVKFGGFSHIGERSTSLNQFEFQQKLLSLFQTTDIERNELIENGFSIRSSIKDVLRLYIEKVLHNIITNTPSLIAQFEDRLPRLDQILFGNFRDQLLINLLIDNNFLRINNIYEVEEYFKKQMISQLGEKSMQRYFKYSVKAENMPSLVLSAFRIFQQKPFEREKIEFLNLLFQSWHILSDELKNEFRNSRCQPEISQMEETLQQFSSKIQNGETFIEVSPPIYSHQTEVMIRMGRLINGSFEYEQFALPYTDIDGVINLLRQHTTYTKLSPASIRENDILSCMFFAKHEEVVQLQTDVINQITGNNYKSVDQFKREDQEISTRVLRVVDMLQPKISKFMEALREVLISKDNLEFEKLVHLYHEMLSVATITLDKKSIKNSSELSPDIISNIESGELLNSYVNGVALNDLLNGQTIKISANGDCDSFASSLGTENSIETGSTQKEYPKGIIDLGGGRSKKHGEIYNIQLKDGVFTCPICKFQKVDICSTKCPNCHTELSAIRKAVETETLADLIQKRRQNLEESQNNKQNASNFFSRILMMIFFPFF
jgi:hypothetical protein